MIRRSTINLVLAVAFAIFLFAVQTFIIDSWSSSLFLQALILNSFVIIGIYGFGGFDAEIRRSFEACFVSLAVGSFLGATLAWLISTFFFENVGLEIYAFSYLLSAIVFPLIHRPIQKLADLLTPSKRYLVIGRESEIGSLIDEIKIASNGKVEIYKYMNPHPDTLTAEIEGVSPFDEILIADPVLAAEVAPILARAGENGIRLNQLPSIAETYLKRVPIELVDRFGDYYTEKFAKTNVTPGKKFFDLLFSGLFLVLTLPLTVVLGIIIYIESGRPVLLKQQRIGCDGKAFGFFKLKSMRNAVKEDEDAENPNAAIAKRVTKIGKVIRKTRLDELPQFLNVLNGTMSIIGPRPELESYHSRCMECIPHYGGRYKVKPGITGWAQINYCHTSTMEEYKIKTEYELYYIKNRTLLRDLQIAIKTLATMIGMRGSR